MATAVGDVLSTNNTKRAVCLMTGQLTNNGAPSGATAGVPCYPDPSLAPGANDSGHCFTGRDARESTIVIRSTAGTGTMVGTFVLWGYLATVNEWFPIKLNAGTALAEYSSDKILYREYVLGLGHFDRLYLELQAVGGTGTAFEAWAITGLSSVS